MAPFGAAFGRLSAGATLLAAAAGLIGSDRCSVHRDAI